MTAVKLYDIATGHVETLIMHLTKEEAERYLISYLAQDNDTDHVIYTDTEEEGTNDRQTATR